MKSKSNPHISIEHCEPLKPKHSLLESIYNYLYEDVSWVRGFNSMILVTMLMLFVCFFKVGMDLKWFTTPFELLVLFGIIIVLFCNVPIYTKGFFGITNLLVLLGGLILIINHDPSIMILGVRLNLFFIALLIVVEVIKIIRKKR